MESQDIIQFLESAKVENNIVTISTDSSNPSRCSAGYVRAVTQNEVQIRSLTKYGEDSGIEVLLIGEIVMVEIESHYAKILELLTQSSAPSFSSVELPIKDDGSIVEGSLKAARDNDLIVSLYAEEEELLSAGWVLKVDRKFVTTKQLSDYGCDDGTAVVRIKDIRSMTCNSRSDQVLAFLNEKRKG